MEIKLDFIGGPLNGNKMPVPTEWANDVGAKICMAAADNGETHWYRVSNQRTLEYIGKTRCDD